MKNREIKSLSDTATRKEKEAYEVDRDLHHFIEDKVANDALLFLAEEETKHEEFLKKFREGHYGVDA